MLRRARASRAFIATVALGTGTPVAAFAASTFPIGTPGIRWGAEERAQWLATRTVVRSYKEEVVAKVDKLGSQFDVLQYGALSHDPERYPLYAVKTRGWSPNKPCVLVTGGVHGYETSGVQGAILFLQTRAEAYAEKFNIIVAPCVSPWGYETIQRWNAQAYAVQPAVTLHLPACQPCSAVLSRTQPCSAVLIVLATRRVDPNRSFNPDGEVVPGRSFNPESATDESRALISMLDSLGVEQWACHVDLHETTDTDETEFRPAKAARDGMESTPGEIPDGFYLVADSTNPQSEWHAGIIEAVRKVTHIAPADANGLIIDEPVVQEGVIAIPRPRDLGLCAGVTNAPYATTTEVYPDSPTADDDQCNRAQVAAIVAALEHMDPSILAKQSLRPGEDSTVPTAAKLEL